MAKQIVILAGLVVLAIASFYVVPPGHESTHYTALVIAFGFALGPLITTKLQTSAESTAAGATLPGGVVREGPANLKRGHVMVGGVLKLTPEALMFASHGFAQKAQTHTWDVGTLVSVAPSNTLGIIPNALTLRFGGDQIKVVVMGRELWMRDIQRLADARRSVAA